MRKILTLLFVGLVACSSDPVEPEKEIEEPEGTPPKTWLEHWGDHDHLLLHRVYYNDDVAIYFDSDMNPEITWPNRVLTKAWKYTKAVYGDFGPENRLYAIFHGTEYSGGHPAGYHDESHDYRSAIDMGGSGGGSKAWFNDDLDSYGIPIHEIGHIVEGDGSGVNGSPAFAIWGDSKWCEIYAYDLFLGIGMTSEAQEVHDICMATYDDFPREGTHWFRDWFFPIYDQYGKTEVLQNYFQLLAEHFPKESAPGGYLKYRRDMNHGEFVHFWSGAAGVNLKELAANAFGWPQEFEAEFNKARQDFPGIQYTE